MDITMFVMTLLVGFLFGAVTILMLAYYLDSRNDREIMRRSKAVADYVVEYDVSAKLAYDTLKHSNFVL